MLVTPTAHFTDRYQDIKAWISNQIQCFMWDVITHLCPNFNGGLGTPPLKLGHG